MSYEKLKILRKKIWMRRQMREQYSKNRTLRKYLYVKEMEQEKDIYEFIYVI